MEQRFKLFTGLPQEDIQRILAFFRLSRFNKKQPVLFTGSSQDFIYLVRSGRVKVSYLSPEGKEITVTILHPGDIYSMHSEAAATVLESAEILYLETSEFKRLVLSNPALTANLIRILGDILKNTNDALLNLAFKEVNSRLASLLLKRARQAGNAEGSSVSFELELTHEEIAKLINSTRQTVTTVLNRLEKAGVIKLHRKKITVYNLDELEALS